MYSASHLAEWVEKLLDEQHCSRSVFVQYLYAAEDIYCKLIINSDIQFLTNTS